MSEIFNASPLYSVRSSEQNFFQDTLRPYSILKISII